MLGDSNVEQSIVNGLKWLVNTAIALLAAGGSIVAILQYINQPGPPSTPIPTSMTPTVITSMPPPDPTATQTNIPPTIVYDTPTPLIPSPTDFILSYWQNVSDGRYENAWAQLSPRFQQAWHHHDYADYLRGYQRMNLCKIIVSNINLIRQDVYSAVVMAHLTYRAGSQCNSSEYNFEMQLIYDTSNNSWLFDENEYK